MTKWLDANRKIRSVSDGSAWGWGPTRTNKSNAGAIGTTAALWLVSVALVVGQAGRDEKPPMAEDVFKNVQILKGIPVDEFMGTMAFFSAALGMNCTDCHVEESGGSWAR